MSHGTDSISNAEGVVKWFDPKKGFGFVIGPEGQDIFVHYTKIEGEGFRVLKDATLVVYDAEKTDKGWHASRVCRAPTADDPASASSPSVASIKHSHARTPRR
ncbi:MAG: cold shock domain-containing protein [Phycisphaerales bacterium]